MTKLKSAMGRWVVGDDFFNRSRELELLKSRVEAGNHVRVTGQRRMGKTSVTKELGRRLVAGPIRRPFRTALQSAR